MAGLVKESIDRNDQKFYDLAELETIGAGSAKYPLNVGWTV